MNHNLNQSIEHTIKLDIYNLLYSLNYIYNINDLQLLTNRYLPNITTNNNNNNTNTNTNNNTNNNNNNTYYKNIKYRCNARCWGGKHTVKYNPITKKWYYGTRCTRYTNNNNQLCKTHHKLSLTSFGLPHGTFDSIPPHPHYNKYKISIQRKFNIKID
jgi:hypothetical protein